MDFDVRDPAQGPSGEAAAEDGATSAGLVYEGDLRMLLALISRGSSTKVYFNFLYSMEFLKILIYTRARGTNALGAIKAAMDGLHNHGWVFSADSSTMRRGYQELGLPVTETFPFSSLFADARDFSKSLWDIGFLVETKRELRAALRTTKRIKSKSPSVTAKILLSNQNLLPANASLIHEATLVSLPEVGERYLDLLEAKVWGMLGRSNHHLFGSSGRVIDIASNRGVVCTGLFNSHGAGLKDSSRLVFHSKNPFEMAAGFATHPDEMRETYLGLESSSRKAHETIAEIVESLEAFQGSEAAAWPELKSVQKEVDSYEKFFSSFHGQALLRLALRLPRAALWKIFKLK